MSNIKQGLRTLLATAVLVAAFAIPAQAALAQSNCSNGDPTASQYCSVNGVNTGSNSNGPTTAAAETEGTTPAAVTPVAANAVDTSGSGTLPFTGFDVGILVLVAAGLGAAGLVLRRLTSSGVPGAQR